MPTSTLTITYNGNNPTGNRIAYRRTTDPPGVYTYVNGTCVGALCTEIITVPFLDDLSCTPITYEGYVQALCHLISDPLGQVGFTTSTFTPAEPCYSERLACVLSDVESILVTGIGSGYAVPPAAGPAVSFSSGIAAATAFVGDDSVKRVSTSVQGVGYVDGTYNVAQLTSTGAGTGASFFVTVIGGVVSILTPPVVTTPIETYAGSGYIVGELITLAPFSTGNGAILKVEEIYPTGTIMYIDLTATDAYATAPVVTIVGLATADAIMARCQKWQPTQCDGNPTAGYIQLELGDNIIFCTDTHAPMVIPPNYSQIHQGCCYDSIAMTFTANDATAPILTYLDFATGQWIEITLADGIPVPLTIVVDAYYIFPLTADVTVI